MSLTSNRKAMSHFAWDLIGTGAKLLTLAWFKPKNLEDLQFEFADLYSRLWDRAEHSISHADFTLPTALGEYPVNKVNQLLLKLYGGRFASLSFSGSSGALVTLLTAVLPKLHPNREIILYDNISHQSALGGLIFGRWKSVRLQRQRSQKYETARPLTLRDIQMAIEQYGAKQIAAILLVSPSYDGFTSPSEIRKIYALAKSHGITVIIDGAWDPIRFRKSAKEAPPLSDICDIWITSPHKRGLTPSALGCMITQDRHIADLWDEAQELGFRSSSVSFVNIMMAEHRLQKIIDGHWDIAFSKTETCAKRLRAFLPELHPQLTVASPADIQADTGNPTHILIGTHALGDFDARIWAQILASEFQFDVEKATPSTLLLICGSPAHLDQLGQIKSILKQSFGMALARSTSKYVN